MPNGQGFIVDVKITICFPLGDDPFCIPEHGLHMLQHQEIPACSKNFTDMMKSEILVIRRKRKVYVDNILKHFVFIENVKCIGEQ